MTWNAFIFFFVMPAMVALLGFAALYANDWAIRRDDRRAAAKAAGERGPSAEGAP